MSDDGEDLCRCGHVRSLHFRDRNSCMHSTETETWACACAEFALAARDMTEHGGYFLVLDLVGGPANRPPEALIGTFLPVTAADGSPIRAEVIDAERRVLDDGRSAMRVRAYSPVPWQT